MEKTFRLPRPLVIRFEIFGAAFLLAFLAGLCAGCGGGEGGNGAGLADVTLGVAGGLDFVAVGPVTVTALPPTGTCEVPSAAKSFISLPSPMKYEVAASNVLWCTQGLPITGYSNNIDFSKPPITDLSCLELVSDVPAVKTDLAGEMDMSEWACCSFVEPYIGSTNGKSADTGYVQTRGVACFPIKGAAGLTVDLQVAALCSISGTFMGWSCGGMPSGGMAVLPVK